MNDNGILTTVRAFLVAFLVIGLLLPVTGCISSDEEKEDEKVTFNMTMTTTAPRDTGVTTVWDATADIQKITPSGSNVPWTDVSIVVKDATGSVVLPLTTVKEDTDDYGSGVEVWYLDGTGGRDRADEGDAIKVSGLTMDHEGGQISIFFKDDRVGTMNLPTDFA